MLVAAAVGPLLKKENEDQKTGLAFSFVGSA